MDFGKTLDKFHIYVNEISVFSFRICILYIPGVHELILFADLVQDGNAMGKKDICPMRSSSFAPYSWQSALYNLQEPQIF